MNIDFKTFSKSAGYKKLKKSVLRDTNQGNKCFNVNGCNKERYIYKKDGCYCNTKCMHNYCSKFKEIIDLVKKCKYETGINEIDIINCWMGDQYYWYMNYLQDYKRFKQLAIESCSSMKTS